ncbi:MAG: hypothetical protein ACLTKE_12235 [Coprococcus sp.]
MFVFISDRKDTLDVKFRNDSALNYGFQTPNAVKSDYKERKICRKYNCFFRADKEKGTCQLFANGKKVLTIDLCDIRRLPALFLRLQD